MILIKVLGPVEEEELLDEDEPEVELPEVIIPGPPRPPGAAGGIFM